MVDAAKVGMAVAALIVGGVIGAAATLALLNVNIASITAQIVPSSGGGDSVNSTQPLITIDLGTLEAGKSYYFDDVYGEAQLYTETGGPVTFYLDFNASVFEYVKVEIEIEYYNGHDDETIAEFYLDTSNPTYTVDLPADTEVKVKVDVERITVSADAAPGMYTVLVGASG